MLPRNIRTVFSEIKRGAENDFWEGKAADIAQNTGLTLRTVYNSIDTLKSLDCLILIRHGNGRISNRYRLLKDPTDEMYDAIRDRSLTNGLERTVSRYDRLQDSITKLSNRLAVLTNKVAVLEATIKRNNG